MLDKLVQFRLGQRHPPRIARINNQYNRRCARKVLCPAPAQACLAPDIDQAESDAFVVVCLVVASYCWGTGDLAVSDPIRFLSD